MPDNDTATPAQDQTDESTAAPDQPIQDSAAFTRCASCRHAADIDLNAGVLVCKKHNMRCNADTGVIPDDCLQYEQAE